MSCKRTLHKQQDKDMDCSIAVIFMKFNKGTVEVFLNEILLGCLPVSLEKRSEC